MNFLSDPLQRAGSTNGDRLRLFAVSDEMTVRAAVWTRL